VRTEGRPNGQSSLALRHRPLAPPAEFVTPRPAQGGMDISRCKVLVIGPKRCGKTRIADFLSNHTEAPNFEVYKPTKGTRILEFEQEVQSGKKSFSAQVQLWDCSGDRQYEACWPAILRDVQGVILVYDPTIKEQEKDIELWYKSYTSRLGLKDAQIMCFAHQAQAVGGKQYQSPRALDRFRFLNTTLDSEDSSNNMRQAFSTFLGSVAAAALEKTTADLDASLQGL